MALGEKDETAARPKVFSDLPGGMRRGGVDDKRASVDHDFAVNPRGLCGYPRNHETPVLWKATKHEHPVHP